MSELSAQQLGDYVRRALVARLDQGLPQYIEDIETLEKLAAVLTAKPRPSRERRSA